MCHYNGEGESKMGSNSRASEDNVWSSILTQVRSNGSKNAKLLQSGQRVLVLGPPSSGKTTLVAKLQGIEDPKKGSGLEYTYIEIRDEYRDDSTHLSVFTLDGDFTGYSHLLRFALNEECLKNTTLIITVSMSTPWLIMEQLQYWATILHDHVDSLKLNPDELKALRRERVLKWVSYIEPGNTNSTTISTSDDIVTTPTSNSTSDVGEDLLLPESVLTRNMGLDLIVVVTKTDLMINQLEKDYDYKEEHFDFVQMHVRKFCLTYGASLFYTSVKEDKNCDLLYKYLVHRIYGLGFKTPALVVEKEAVFIPSGWDNLKKIQILHENITSFNPEDYFDNVIQRPNKKEVNKNEASSNAVLNLEEVVEEEQRFLERQLQILNLGGTGGNVMKSSAKTPDKRLLTPGSGSSVSGGSAGGGPSSVSSSNTTPKKGECTDRVLANFFNSLLTSKKTGTSPQQQSNNNSLGGTDC